MTAKGHKESAISFSDTQPVEKQCASQRQLCLSHFALLPRPLRTAARSPTAARPPAAPQAAAARGLLVPAGTAPLQPRMHSVNLLTAQHALSTPKRLKSSPRFTSSSRARTPAESL